MSKWIRFEQLPQTPTRKTLVWAVVTKAGDAIIGHISWFSRWRGYAFYPGNSTLFEPTCLRDIAAFIQEQNAAHWQARRQNKT